MQFAEFALQGRRLSNFSLAAVCASLLLAVAVVQTAAVESFKTASRGHLILRFDRNDALLEDRLGQIERDSSDGTGIRHLRRATQLSPLNRHYRSHLAEACDASGDTACANRELDFLAKLCPMMPLYQFHAAESYLRSNRMYDALAKFQRAIELDATYGPASWSDLRPAFDPDLIFRKTIAPAAAPELKLSYVSFLSNQGDDDDADAAFRIWQLVVPENLSANEPQNVPATAIPAFPFAAAKPYLERLIDLDRVDEADKVWYDLQRLKIVATPVGSDADDLIFNGDFEQLPLNAGFDWRWTGQNADLAIDFAAPAAYHGAHCLRIDFTVSRNEEYEPVFQLVPVLPSHSYRLEAYVRSDEITSDTGPSLRVSNNEDATFKDAVSQTTVGTTAWHPIALSFTTGPATQWVRLSVWRPHGRVFPTEISGTFWLDAVSLHDVGSAVPSPFTKQAATGQP